MPARRTHDDIRRAIAQLNDDGELIPLADLAGLPLDLAGEWTRPPVRTLLRWGQTGRNGVYLDVLWQRSRLTWVTSKAAVERFRADATRCAAALSPTT